ncbi:CAP domain-containing protein [Sphingopyxis sp. H050]|jgi:hypothetical protein|uniref:CAP domain-containing protein n=1 Tax=Sphingopyxis sp. H050 TaxID=1759072 RepID=UPI0009EB7D12|nr:CAP domain-containing protein [Sphingopyxis sp. H050]
MRVSGKTACKVSFVVASAFLLTGVQSRLGDLDYRLLESHNRERVLAGVPQLKWNVDLAEGAQAWADHLSATGRFEHSPNVPGKPLEGENIWGGTPGAFRPESMVNLWIEEKKFFVNGTFPANSSTGRPQDVSHYTQLIWASSQEVGCGLSNLGAEEILVCRYSEPGNIRGRDPFAHPKSPAPRLAYSDFKVPLASSAASLAGFSSAATTAFEPAAGSAVSMDMRPAVSSATRRGDMGPIFWLGTITAGSGIGSPRLSCGWSASNCSWLMD